MGVKLLGRGQLLDHDAKDQVGVKRKDLTDKISARWVKAAPWPETARPRSGVDRAGGRAGVSGCRRLASTSGEWATIGTRGTHVRPRGGVGSGW